MHSESGLPYAGWAGTLGGADQRPTLSTPGRNQRPPPRAPEHPRGHDAWVSPRPGRGPAPPGPALSPSCSLGSPPAEIHQETTATATGCTRPLPCTIGFSECGRDRPQFGWPPNSLKIARPAPQAPQRPRPSLTLRARSSTKTHKDLTNFDLQLVGRACLSQSGVKPGPVHVTGGCCPSACVTLHVTVYWCQCCVRASAHARQH